MKFILTQWFSTWGSFAIFLRVARASDKNIHNNFPYFIFRTWNHSWASAGGAKRAFAPPGHWD